MKKINLIAISLIFLLNSCVKVNTPGGIVVWGSKEVITKNLDFEHFNELIVSDKFQVTIRQGEKYSVKAKINKNLVEFLDIQKKWTLLSLKMKPNHFYKDAVLEIELTMPELEYMDIKGMSLVNIEKFNINAAIFEISAASELTGNLSANRLEMIVKNGSKANLTGNTQYLKMEGVISAKINLSQFATNSANIYLSVGSEGQFKIDDVFNAAVKNGSTLTYSGTGSEGKVIKDNTSKVVKR